MSYQLAPRVVFPNPMGSAMHGKKAPRWLFAGWLWAAAAVILLGTLLSLRLAPSVIRQGRDSGIFAYTGQVILEGGLPYRDAWDNKPPGVYYIDVLAFWLLGANRWALWWIDLGLVVCAGLVIWVLLRQVYEKPAPVWGGTLAFLFLSRHPGLVWDTDFSEVYALFPQALCFLLGFWLLRRPGYRTAFALGLVSSAVFLIRQTTIGISLAFIPALLVSAHPIYYDRRRWSLLAAVIGGGVLGLGCVALSLQAYGVLDDAWAATFVHPTAFHNWVSKGEGYTHVMPWDTLWVSMTKSAFLTVILRLVAPFLVFGVVAAVKGVQHRHYADHQAATRATVRLWAALAFGFDLALANLTNRGYEHYYVVLLPSLAVLIALCLTLIPLLRPHLGRVYPLAVAVLVIYFIPVGYGPVKRSLDDLKAVNWNITGPVRNRPFSNYVLMHTQPDDMVFVWGAATNVNFQSGRRSPTRFHYAYPLIVPGFTPPEWIQEVVNDLEENQPVLIVDTTLIDGDRIPPLDPQLREVWWAHGGRRDVPDLEPLYDFVNEHCSIVARLGSPVVYRCTY